jgi:hypothetical protein
LILKKPTGDWFLYRNIYVRIHLLVSVLTYGENLLSIPPGLPAGLPMVLHRRS